MRYSPELRKKSNPISPGDIRLVTYNIHQCIGRDGIENINRTALAICDLEAHVIGIQELGSYHAKPGFFGRLQVETIMEATGMVAVTGPTIHHPNSDYGNCLLTRETIVDVRRFDISEKGCEPRGLLDVDLEIEGRVLRVMVTHLGLRAWERYRQVEKILNYVEEGPDLPIVMMGDFNEWFPWSRTLRLLHKRFGKQAGRATFPAWFPVLALDRVWVDPAGYVREIRRIMNPATRPTSDHLPLEIILNFKRGVTSPAREAFPGRRFHRK